MTTEWIRHGDVALVRVGKSGLPPASEQKTYEQEEAVLAEGEITGHEHVLAGDLITTWEKGEAEPDAIVTVQDESATLTHPEHNTVEVPEGTWRVIRQREHWGGQTRRVLD